MAARLRKALIWAVVLFLVSCVLAGPLSMAVAHGSGTLLYLGPVMAMNYEWPGAKSLVALAVYQLIYYCTIAVVVAVVLHVPSAVEFRTLR